MENLINIIDSVQSEIENSRVYIVSEGDMVEFTIIKIYSEGGMNSVQQSFKKEKLKNMNDELLIKDLVGIARFLKNNAVEKSHAWIQ